MASVRRVVDRGRLVALAVARRGYVRLASGPLHRVAEWPLVQWFRRRLRHPMSLQDVFDILDVLDAVGVRWWLAGGWGVDALIGRPTRRHKDLDLVIERDDVESAVMALAARGFGHMPPQADGSDRQVAAALMPFRELMLDAAGRTIDMHPIDSRTWPAPVPVAEPFTCGVLAGRRLNCLSAEAQRAAHQGFELLEEHRANLRLLDSMTSGPVRPVTDG
jgi:lincosamide nucleotidyltransferase A/C/D/E